MASKSFLEILADELRQEVRQELRDEVRQQLEEEARAKSQRDSQAGARRNDSAKVERGLSDQMDIWLRTHFDSVNVSKAGLGRKAYARPQTARPREESSRNAEARVRIDSADALFALELLRRHGGVDLGHELTLTELKAAWRRAALKTHPDRFAQDDVIAQARAAARFAELSEAYEMLQALFEKAASREAA